jgi:hypothetical protein
MSVTYSDMVFLKPENAFLQTSNLKTIWSEKYKNDQQAA